MRSTGTIWAVGAYFNPLHYRSRLANYRTFRSCLQVPLAVCELSHDDHFELTDGDADIMIRRSSPDVLWQKEALLNLVIKAVPRDVATVAWFDVDVVLEREDWPARALAKIEDGIPVIQLFDRVLDLGPGADPHNPTPADVVCEGPGFVSASHDPANEQRLFGSVDAVGTIHGRTRSPGFAWAARRDLVEELGLYDRCILGSGDRAFACAALGRHRTAGMRWVTNSAQRRHFDLWAERLDERVRGAVGFIEGGLRHLWHGRIEDRKYRERYLGLARFDFDPERDIAMAANGTWRWSSAKPELHSYVLQHFAERREDLGMEPLQSPDFSASTETGFRERPEQASDHSGVARR